MRPGDDLPAGFTLDELPEGFTLDEPAATAPTTESGYTHPLARFGAGGLQAVKAAINPMTYVRAARELAPLGVNIARSMGPAGIVTPTPELMEAGQGLAAMPGQIVDRATESPEGLGEVVGSVALGAVPAGGAVSKLGQWAGYTRAARAAKIIRAVRPKGGAKATKAFSERIAGMEPEIDLPVSATHSGLARALKQRRDAASVAVRDAEAALPTTDIPVDDIARRIPEPEGVWATNAKGVMEFVPHDPTAFAAYQATIRRLQAAGGAQGTLSTPDVISMKKVAGRRAAQGRAYETPVGDEAAITPEAWKAQAAAARGALEDLPGPEAAAYSAARRESHIAQTLETPAGLESARLEKLPPYARGTEILLGRAGAAGRGGPVGALVGLAGGQFLDSTLYLTASAAVKKRVIAALESGQPQLAAEILFRSSIADEQRRRAAADALTAQGEGVTTP